MRDKIRKGGTLAAALMFFLLTAAPKTAYGADAINTAADDCSLTFRLDNLIPSEGGTADTEYKDLMEGSGVSVYISLYKIADITENGRYTVTASGEEADVAGLQKMLSDVDANTRPDEWAAMAERASALLGVDTEKEIFPDTPYREQSGDDGTATIDGLKTGLYLAAAEPAQSAEYRYTFSPYLISLPDNRYYNTGDDRWDYHPEVGLKAAWEQRFASLVIEKELLSYNATLGSTSFIFQIDAVKGGFHYSDVVSLQFDGRETRQTLPITDKIPAGADVTVTEIYTGASYQISGNSVQTVSDITADDVTTVIFANVYDESSLKGGSSIVNHFPYTEPDASAPEGRQGTWDVEQQKDSSAEGRRI